MSRDLLWLVVDVATGLVIDEVNERPRIKRGSGRIAVPAKAVR